MLVYIIYRYTYTWHRFIVPIFYDKAKYLMEQVDLPAYEIQWHYHTDTQFVKLWLWNDESTVSADSIDIQGVP